MATNKPTMPFAQEIQGYCFSALLTRRGFLRLDTGIRCTGPKGEEEVKDEILVAETHKMQCLFCRSKTCLHFLSVCPVADLIRDYIDCRKSEDQGDYPGGVLVSCICKRTDDTFLIWYPKGITHLPITSQQPGVCPYCSDQAILLGNIDVRYRGDRYSGVVLSFGSIICARLFYVSPRPFHEMPHTIAHSYQVRMPATPAYREAVQMNSGETAKAFVNGELALLLLRFIAQDMHIAMNAFPSVNSYTVVAKCDSPTLEKMLGIVDMMEQAIGEGLLAITRNVLCSAKHLNVSCTDLPSRMRKHISAHLGSFQKLLLDGCSENIGHQLWELRRDYWVKHYGFSAEDFDEVQ